MDTNNPEKKRKNFFKKEAERNIWIRVNAERLQYCDIADGMEDRKLGSIDEKYTYMWVSNNQLNYDEHECDAPRFSMEELLLNSLPELYRLTKRRMDEEMLKAFNECEAERKRREQNGEEMA